MGIITQPIKKNELLAAVETVWNAAVRKCAETAEVEQQARERIEKEAEQAYPFATGRSLADNVTQAFIKKAAKVAAMDEWRRSAARIAELEGRIEELEARMPIFPHGESSEGQIVSDERPDAGTMELNNRLMKTKILVIHQTKEVIIFDEDGEQKPTDLMFELGSTPITQREYAMVLKLVGQGTPMSKYEVKDFRK